MRRFLLAFLLTTVVASLQAITIKWQIAASEYTWDQNATVHLVYSETNNWTAEQVATAGQDGNQFTGYKISGTGVATITPIGKDATNVTGTTYTAGLTANEGTPSYNVTTLDDTAFGEGYFYLVVFNTKEGDPEYGHYAVSQAQAYIPNDGLSDAAAGIYDTKVDGEAPELGDFVLVPWMGGNWTSATVPEPTALALLALGVASLALRRKI